MSGISVIIPVYNAEKHLSRCLDSLIAQTYSDWEAVCVDDGSPDSSGAILDRYAAADARFKVLHKENGGVGAARNDALANASGRWIMFVDSDDFLHPQAMEICNMLGERDGSDIVTYTYSRPYRTRLSALQLLHLPEPRRIRFPRIDASSVESIRVSDIFEWATEYSRPDKGADSRFVTKHCQPWRAFCRAEIVRDIKFVSGIIYEDFPWWTEVLLRTRKATLTPLSLYYYYPSLSGYIFSTPQQKKIDSLQVAIDASDKVMENADPHKRELWEATFRTPFASKLQSKKNKR